MAKTVVGLFDDFSQAQEVVRDLVENGIARENISLIANDAEGRYARELGSDVKDAETKGEAAAKSAGIGAALGGITGLLVGIGTVALPGIGTILGAGPLIAALTGAGVGAVTGGLVGGLTQAGVPEPDANIYSEGVRRGGSLVLAYVDDQHADHTAEIMNRHRPIDLEQRSAAWKSERWQGFNENAEPFAFDQTNQTFRERQPSSTLDFGPGARSYIAGQPVSDYDRQQADLGNYKNDTTEEEFQMQLPRFRKHFDTTNPNAAGRWQEFMVMYYFGFALGRQENYRAGDWDIVRDAVRREWEGRYPDGQWDEFEDAVYEGWRAGRQT